VTVESGAGAAKSMAAVSAGPRAGSRSRLGRKSRSRPVSQRQAESTACRGIAAEETIRGRGRARAPRLGRITWPPRLRLLLQEQVKGRLQRLLDRGVGMEWPRSLRAASSFLVKRRLTLTWIRLRSTESGSTSSRVAADLPAPPKATLGAQSCEGGLRPGQMKEGRQGTGGQRRVKRGGPFRAAFRPTNMPAPALDPEPTTSPVGEKCAGPGSRVTTVRVAGVPRAAARPRSPWPPARDAEEARQEQVLVLLVSTLASSAIVVRQSSPRRSGSTRSGNR